MTLVGWLGLWVSNPRAQEVDTEGARHPGTGMFREAAAQSIPGEMGPTHGLLGLTRRCLGWGQGGPDVGGMKANRHLGSNLGRAKGAKLTGFNLKERSHRRFLNS